MCINNNYTCNLTLLATNQSSTSNIIGRSTIPGQVHAASGLNWGYNAGLAFLGDAYIPVNRDNIIEAREMFIKPYPVNVPINAVWDDGTEMTLLLEGNGVDLCDGNFYPKQISTYGNKSILGNYLRERIGTRIGRNLLYSQYAIDTLANIKSSYIGNKEDITLAIRDNPTLLEELNNKFITLDDLNQYGRTTISVRLENNEEGNVIYRFNFSIGDF